MLALLSLSAHSEINEIVLFLSAMPMPSIWLTWMEFWSLFSLSLKMDQDSLKRYTDCVYFLASPLTCKKVPLLSILFIHSSFCNANIFFDCRKPSFCFSFQLYYVSFFFFFSAYLMCWSLIHYMTFLLAIADVLDLMLFALCFSGGWMWVSA